MPFVGIVDLGLVGVDLFFVLSGFIIMHVTARRGISCLAFARARFRRIYLPYWPLGLAAAVMTYGIPYMGSGVFRGWFASITLLPFGYPALNVAWTLQHEIVFYGFVALGIITGWLRLGLLLWAAAIVGFLVLDIDAPIGLQPLDAEFLMGIAAWAAWRSRSRKTMITISIILLAIGGIVLGYDAHWKLDRAGPIAFAVLFAAGLPWLVLADQNGKIRTPRSLSFLGEASYSIYLFHALPILVLVAFPIGGGWQVFLPVATLGGLAGGIIYYWLVERPSLSLMPKTLAWRATP